MRKEHIYSKLICGALLLFGICVPVCAQTGHLSGVRVINDEIKKKGREIHVDFVLDVTDMHVKRQESVRLYPVVVAKEGIKVWIFLLWCWTVVFVTRCTVVKRR